MSNGHFIEQKLDGFSSTGTFSWRDVLSSLLRAVVEGGVKRIRSSKG